MKNTAFLFITLLSLLSGSCVINFPDSISGNGHVIKQTRDVPEFSGIKVSSGIDVYLTQGETQSVDVEADENLQEWIRTEVSGGLLIIHSDKAIRMAKTKRVNIICKTINEIDISSAGDVTGLSKFTADRLLIDLSSAGDLKFEVDAKQVDITLSSAGNADLKGATDELKAELSSAGDLNAFDLLSKKAEVSVSSAGNARVYVTEEARFRSSSAGNIIYKGDPQIKEINTSSAGSVNKKN